MLMNQSSYKKNGIKYMTSQCVTLHLDVVIFVIGSDSAPFFCNRSKQWIKGNMVNLICETKSVLTQDILIMITCSNKTLQLPKTMAVLSAFTESFEVSTKLIGLPPVASKLMQLFVHWQTDINETVTCYSFATYKI